MNQFSIFGCALGGIILVALGILIELSEGDPIEHYKKLLNNNDTFGFADVLTFTGAILLCAAVVAFVGPIITPNLTAG